MFGLIISGRLPETNFRQVDQNKLMIDISDIDNVNYLVVFLTGTLSLPIDTAAAVYFSWPNLEGTPTWLYLGYISNSKPSAIFKIVHLKKLHVQQTATNMVFGNMNVFHTAQLGISVEPEQDVIQLTAGLEVNDDIKINFCQKMLESFYLYAESFAVNAGNLSATSIANSDVVPLNTLQNWYNLFQTRLQRNPNFWKH